MIVERKQYGCITMIFVQIGLVLFVIVLFLAPQADGRVRPVVLSVQKVAEARTGTATNFSSQIESTTLKLEAKLTETGHIDSVNNHDRAISSISSSDRLVIENTIADQFVAKITGRPTVQLSALGEATETSVVSAIASRTVANPIDQPHSVESSIVARSVGRISFSIYITGTSPRAPSVLG